MRDSAVTSRDQVDKPPHSGMEMRQLLRSWRHNPRTRRLMLAAGSGALALLALFVLGCWQVNNQFQLLEGQRESLERNRRMVMTLDEAINVQRNAYTTVVAELTADRTAAQVDQAKLEQVLGGSEAAIAALFARLTGAMEATDQPAVTSFRQSLEGSLMALRDMESAFLANDGKINLDEARRTTMRFIMESGTLSRSLQNKSLERMRNNAQASELQFRQARWVAFAVLVTGGIVVLVLGWMLVSYIHKRDQVEEYLRHTTELWQSTLNTLQQGVAVFTRDQALVLWNPRLPQLHGIPVEALHIGMSAAELIRHSVRLKGESTDDELQRMNATFETVARGEGMEFEVAQVGGTRIHIQLLPMLEDYYILTLMDVTRIRLTERLANERAVRLDTIMNNVPDAIVTINASGSIESWNAAAEQLFGYQVPEIIRRNVSVLMSEPYASQHDHFIARYLREGDSQALGRLREFSARRQDGSEFPIDLRISEMQLDDKRMFVGIIRDITERRAIEQMKSAFIATVSHELRTPLTSIMGALTLLTSGFYSELSSKAQRLVSMAEKNSQRLARLINDILDLEKAEAGRLTVRLEPLSLLPLVQHSLDMNRSYGTRFDVELQLLDGAIDVKVAADEVRFLQIMANLLSNAIKHSPAYSTVLVEITSSDRIVRVTVHDAGEGIEDVFKTRVFQRFAQADGSDAKPVSGTGLGLAIAKQLVELHGGRIGFDSGISKTGAGTGASFWFELPVIPEAEIVADHQAALNLNVVLCEDDPDAAQVLTEMLTEQGCRVRHVDRAALVPSSLDPSVSALLMDMDLPDQNGLKLVAQLRQEPRWYDLPVLVVSGKRFTQDEQTTYNGLRIAGWLDKPVERHALYMALLKTIPR